MKQERWKTLFTPILVALFIVSTFTSINAQDTKMKTYKVSPSLRQVDNLQHFNKTFPLDVKKRVMLTKNLFVVSETDSKQLFHIYENNEYKQIPSFVTTDAVLHLYHIFFDYTLRNVEEKTLLPILQSLTKGMLEDSIKTWNETEDAKLKQAALKNIAYFAVAARNLEMKTEVPAEAEILIQNDMKLIEQHEGFKVGAIFPYRIDYSQFVPRGHYTRSPELKKFFKAMMWYGLVPFAVKTNTGRADEQIRQSILLTQSLYRTGLKKDWERIYEPTTFYVGAADDITPSELKNLMDSVFGAEATESDFADAQKFNNFATRMEKLRAAKIQFKNLADGKQTEMAGSEVQFRFMGQRYIPDSEILQRLSVPIKRVFPTGLDVMSVMGSKRATNILDAYPALYNPMGWDKYKPERGKLIEEFSKLDSKQWTSNLYWGWLNSLRALIDPVPENYPSFMQNTAWQDKSLNTALGSWAELRHDTVLYGKQSGAEMGDGEEPVTYKGYVEPNVVFWGRLLDLTKQSHEGLKSRKLLPENLGYKFEMFEDMLANLKKISKKELRNEKLTEEEYKYIRQIGGSLEYLTLSVMTGNPDTWELVNETDKDMAVIADVHTGGNKVLEEAVGRANEIFVIVPIEGKLVLTRGAVFSYYEFLHPTSDRLTDEKWQQMLNSDQTPKPPIWTRSFLLSKAK